MSSKDRSQRNWRLAGLGLGLIFLLLATARADLRGAWHVLQHAQATWLAAVLACAILFMLLKTIRWRFILAPILRARFGLLHEMVYVGTAANLVVAHTGELARATLLGRRAGVSSSAVLATVAIERVLDFAALLVLASLALIIDPRASSLLWSAGLVGLAITAAGLVVLLTMLNPHPRLKGAFHSVTGLLPPGWRDWLIDQLTRGRAGLAVLRRPRVMLGLLGISLLQWSAVVAAMWASAAAAGVTVPVSAAITVFVLTVIGMTLPSAPVQLGTVQLAFVVGLDLAGANAAAAFAASLVYTCFVNMFMMAIGAVCWLRESWAGELAPMSGGGLAAAPAPDASASRETRARSGVPPAAAP